MRSRVFFCVVVVVAVGVFGVVGCDLRPSLAQLRIFSGYRPELVAQCCQCLAQRGTGADDASCELGVFVDGGVNAPDGSVTGSGDRDFDLNDFVDDGEVPCLCGDLTQAECVDALSNGEDGAPPPGIVVPGACIDQVDRTAPCENACVGVLSFEPI